MKSDAQLLSEFCKASSQDAFRQLLARHRPLVIATCLRELNDQSAAEDATQVVFLLLVKKADSLKNRDSIAGWLFQSARWVCKNMRKQEQIRTKREQQEFEDRTSPDVGRWAEIESSLNDGLASLSGSEREAILLRYFAGMTLAEIGTRLGVSEDAARMRTSRAVRGLRAYFVRERVVLEMNAFVTLLVTKCLVNAMCRFSFMPAQDVRVAAGRCPAAH